MISRMELRAILVLVASGGSVMLASCAGEQTPGPSDPRDDPAPPAVLLPNETPGPLSNNSDRYVGVALAHQSVDVAAELEGQLSTIYVRVGDRVEPGDRIASIETRQLTDELSMARADLRALQAEEKQAAIDLEAISERYQRRRSVADLYSPEEVEALRIETERAAAALETATARMSREAAFVRQLQGRLSFATVASPIAGTVAARYLDPGALVQPGTAVVRLITTDAFVARFAVPPEEAGEQRVGLPIRFSATTTALQLPGIITHISPQVDVASEMVFVEADLILPDSWDGQLQSGLVGLVQVDEATVD